MKEAKVAASRRFATPEIDGGKLGQLHELLSAKRNIVITHKLFSLITEETVTLIKKGGYTLILDEEFAVYTQYNNYIKDREKTKAFLSSKANQEESYTISPGEMLQIFNEEQWVSICTEPGWRYGLVQWQAKSKTMTKYAEIERLAKKEQLYCIFGSDEENAAQTSDPRSWTLWIEFPPDVFRAFKNVFALSYHFEGSQINAYFHIHGFEPYFVSTRMINGKKRTSELIPYADSIEERWNIAKCLGIYDGSKNDIGVGYTASGNIKELYLTINKLKSLTEEEAKRIVEAMAHVYKNIYCRQEIFKPYAFSKYVMWTTVKDAARDFTTSTKPKSRLIHMKGANYIDTQEAVKLMVEKHNAAYHRAMERLDVLEKIKRSGRAFSSRQVDEYKKCLKMKQEGIWTRANLSTFIPCNSKATNQYSERRFLAYVINRKMAFGIKHFFKMRGYEIDEDVWALSEMIQWIWRSAIRNGEQVYLFVPSYRMRRLLLEWMGVSIEEAQHLFNEEANHRLSKGE